MKVVLIYFLKNEYKGARNINKLTLWQRYYFFTFIVRCYGLNSKLMQDPVGR